MSEAEVSQMVLDREALEALVADNPDLDRLEALLDRFNILEVLGFVRQELRHSDLACVLTALAARDAEGSR